MTDKTTNHPAADDGHNPADPNEAPKNVIIPPAVGATLDLQRLRLGQNFAADLGVKKQLLVVPVRRPNRHEWIRVQPDESFQLATALFVDKVERGEVYLVDPSLWDELAGDISPYLLHVAITRQGVVFVMPVALPSADGRTNSWHGSLAGAAELAKNSWVRIAANMQLGAYDVYNSVGSWPEPEWPVTSFQQLIDLAFKGRYITSSDHPVLLRLRGER